MMNIKKSQWPISIIIIILMSCAAKKKSIYNNELSTDELVIVGLIEFDYTQLENKSISGIELFFNSEEENKDFQLSKKYLPEERLKEFQFIKIIGDQGIYELNFRQNLASSSETDNLLSVMDMERSMDIKGDNIFQRYNLDDGKIINIGRIIVRYEGGNIVNGNINYSYSFHSIGSDTIALYAFKESYPLVYSKYENDVYFFKNDLEKCIEYILLNISEGKSLMIKDFIDEHPDRVKHIFKDLTPETQEEVASTIEKYTFEELNDFLLEKN